VTNKLYNTQLTLGHDVTNQLTRSTVPHAVRVRMDESSVYKYSVRTQHPSLQPQMTEKEIVSETSDTNATLTLLVAREDFIYCGREN
jgi:hypothetical protein